MRRKHRLRREAVSSQTTSFADGSEITVWPSSDLDEINGVIKNLPLTEPKALHVIPIPAGIKATEEIFLPGETTIDAGYECPECKHRVKGGGEKHRFNLCGCLIVLCQVESNWNEVLTKPDGWNLCLQSVRSARRSADTDNGRE